MEELRPEELEGLVQELEGESEEEEETPSPEVERLLRRLGPWSPEHTRRDAAEQLGRAGTSSPRIVQALIAASESPSEAVSAAAAKSLRAPVHQEILREYPQLMQRTQSTTEPAVTQTGKVHNRKPADSSQIIPVIAFGVVWIGIVAASGAIKVPWLFALVALPGVAVVALALWKWRAATMNREVLLRSAKETVGTVEGKHKKEHESDYGGTSYTYHVTVRFEAEDAKMGARLMVLKAQVSRRVWKGLRSGESIRIQYAAEDPRIALIQGEW